MKRFNLYRDLVIIKDGRPPNSGLLTAVFVFGFIFGVIISTDFTKPDCIAGENYPCYVDQANEIVGQQICNENKTFGACESVPNI